MSSPTRARHLLTFSYIGSPFNASTRTSKDVDHTTVIGSLERAFNVKRKKLGIDDPSPLVISSRTDRRVHALMNTAHIDFTVADKCYSANNLITTVNDYLCKRNLPLRILSIQQVTDDFNARTWAQQRSYLYRIAVPKDHFDNQAVPISEVDRCHFLSDSNFNIDAVEEVLSIFPGVHNFSSFSGRPSKALVDRTPIRHVDSCYIRRGNALMPLLYEPSINNFDFWDFIIEGRSFLYRQVRRMVSAAIGVGQGKLSVSQVRKSLESSTPIQLQRPVVPAHGLYLAKVTYKKEDLLINRTISVNQEYKTLVNLLDQYKEKRSSLNHTCTRVTTVQGNTIIEEVVQGRQTSHEVPEKNQMCPGFVVDTKPDLQVAEILPSLLYLGSQDATQDMELLKKYRITHILSIGVSVVPLPEMSQLSYTFVPALDLPDEKIDFVLATALPLIEEIISKGGCVFVHCNAGVSRSPMVVIAFLMVHRGLTYCKANALVKEKRPAAKPNAGFVKQLLELECKSQTCSSKK